MSSYLLSDSLHAELAQSPFLDFLSLNLEFYVILSYWAASTFILVSLAPACGFDTWLALDLLQSTLGALGNICLSEILSPTQIILLIQRRYNGSL